MQTGSAQISQARLIDCDVLERAFGRMIVCDPVLPM